MTKKELHNQRLVKEAEETAMRMHTRRHFIKECAFGFGSLALGSLFQSCGMGASSNVTTNNNFDPAHPLAAGAGRLPQYRRLLWRQSPAATGSLKDLRPKTEDPRSRHMVLGLGSLVKNVKPQS